ncbi:L-lactate dehydrogenase [Apilactobacillus ozensis]|uniref:L-lactate dehydrogenase n=1 Tax=Apilactobacillus ozensis TaxID=866801 RepID=UPI00200B9607|nr:L-lactate dehydrogenase [Apilactobacillus ozensis]MCK8606653.1 L-lactate dehydrogenase [Apilactobacillus ozensis]
MSRKVGIIGDGHVGSTVAHYIVANGFVDDLVLIDINEKKVNADAVDFEEAMPNLDCHTNIFVNDYDQLKDADVIISALGNIGILDTPEAKGNRFAELPFNQKNVIEVSKKIKASGFKGIVIAITNPVDVITSLYQKFTGLPKERVMGTGTLLDSARMKRAVAKKVGVDSRSVNGYNLGEHGNSQFTAWSTVDVLGHSIYDLVDEYHLDLDQLDEDARSGGFTVFNGKKYTSYGVATAAVRLMNVVLNNSMTVLPVSNYREEYGVYLSYPAVVGREGIIKQTKLELSENELNKLQSSANYIKNKYEEVLNG